MMNHLLTRTQSSSSTLLLELVNSFPTAFQSQQWSECMGSILNEMLDLSFRIGRTEGMSGFSLDPFFMEGELPKLELDGFLSDLSGQALALRRVDLTFFE